MPPPTRPTGDAGGASWDPITPRRTSDVVATDIRRRIVTDEYAEGSPLPSITALTQAYGVSRPTIRETFRVLESESLLARGPDPRSPWRAMPPSVTVAARSAGLVLQTRHASVADLHLVSALLERSSMERAVATPGVVDEIGALDPRAHLHGELARLAGNVTTRTVLEVLAETGRLGTDAAITCHDNEAHRRIVAAAPDPDALVREWHVHLDGLAVPDDRPYRLATPAASEPESETHRVARILRALIAEGTVGFGDRLPSPDDLADLRDVPRTVHREALRILESEGLVRIQPGVRGGVTASRPDTQAMARYMGLLLQRRGASVADFFVARADVETVLAERAALSGAPTARLAESLAAEAEVLGDRAAFTSAGLTFHEVVAQCSGSTTLHLVFELLDEVLQLAARARSGQPDQADRELTTAHAEHARLLELIAGRRPAEARTLWHAHCAHRPRPGDHAPIDVFALLDRAPGIRRRW